jgi:hypothetical protein
MPQSALKSTEVRKTPRGPSGRAEDPAGPFAFGAALRPGFRKDPA